MPSAKVLNAQTAKYDALISEVRMSDYGYWVVTYSVAPCLYLSVMICKIGITSQQAADLAAAPLSVHTGQRVTS